MKACSRQWEAEAAIDDRLSDADKASFERHLATCEPCQKEVRQLERLRDASARLKADGGGEEASELEHRRQRADLLRLANKDLVLDTGPKTRMFGISLPLGRIFAGITFVCVAVALVLVVQRPPSPVAPASSPPTFRMTTTDSWQRIESEAGQTVHVHAGATGHFELEVDKLKSGQRFLVDLPDGELEVQGTRFEINLADGHTKSVRVFEGRVALRIRGEEPRTLNANDVWDVQPVVVAPVPPPPPPPPPASSSAPPPPPVSVTTALPPPSASASAASSAPVSLASAMEAFTSGDYARAETLFAAFAKTNPSDARAEDASFLIAVSREKRGDHEGARAAAGEYLRRYPTGFRRKEAERLAQGN
jgi:TolA-binding protein